MGLWSALTKQSTPFAVAPSQEAFAEQRIVELLPASLKQAFVDARHQMDSMRENQGLAAGSKGTLQAAVLMANTLKITEFVNGLSAADKKLVDCLPANRTIEPEVQKALVRAGVSTRSIHAQAAILTLLEKHAAGLRPSVTADTVAKWK